MKTIYAIEPVFHDGELHLPGDQINCDVNDGASLIGSGRGTEDADRAAAAKKQYAAAQKAKDAAPAPAAAAPVDVQAIVDAAVKAALATVAANGATAAKQPTAGA